MKVVLAAFFLSLSNPSFAQFDQGIQPIVANEVYVVHSNLTANNTIVNTVNIYLIKGVNDTVWVFGNGYGEPQDIQYYRNNSLLNTSGAYLDAQMVDSVIRVEMNLPNASLQFIVPHLHLDHNNQEFVTALQQSEGYNLANANIFVHQNDFFGATCNSACCGNAPCSIGQPGYGAPYDHPWNPATLQKFSAIGSSTDLCNQQLMMFQSSYGPWLVLKADTQHTQGAINLSNEVLALKILGSALGTQCTTPSNWQVLPAHGNVNVSPIVLSNSTQIDEHGFTISSQPNAHQFRIHFNSKDRFERYKISIYNMSGLMVFQSDNLKNHSVIEHSLTEGIYVALSHREGKYIATRKLVVN